MNPKRVRAWMGWLLPAFFLRALIPLGFMPMFDATHGVELVLCETYAPVPSMAGTEHMAMSMEPGMDMSHAVQDHALTRHGGVHQDHGTCLFGTAPALGAPLAIAALLADPQLPAQLFVASPQLSAFEIPIRAQSARGPPV